MKIKHCGTSFPEAIENKVINLIQNSGEKIAAFDADGTLWNNDLGEQFFQFQIDHCNLKSLEGIDPWEYYDTTKKVDPPKAYLWLAQISAGQNISTVKKWAKESLNHFEINIFEPQKKLIKKLIDNKFKVYIVTASVKWAVEPAAHLLGLSEDQVLGIETEVINGVVTDKQKGPITWRQGKAEGLLKVTNGLKPSLCSGNTYGDIALLDQATDLKICIQTQTEKNFLFEEEYKLREHALSQGWYIHQMV